MTESAERNPSRWWWLFLVTGVIWMVLSLIILRFNTASIVTIGVLVGAMILAAGINEFLIASVVPNWKWLHYVLGGLFVAFGIIAMFSPGRTFWAMAMIIGWFLLFKGTFDIVMAFLTKSVNEAWWLGLIVGVMEILLAFWAAGGFGNKVALLVIWAAAGALARGVTEIVTAFAIRKAGKEDASHTAGMPPAALA